MWLIVSHFSLNSFGSTEVLRAGKPGVGEFRVKPSGFIVE